jgi:hypothetical protein
MPPASEATSMRSRLVRQNAGRRILDHDAARRRDAQRLGSEQKERGVRLAAR